MSWSPGDAVAAGGIVLASFTLLDNTGPGHQAVMAADPDDPNVLAQLRQAEIVSAIVILAAVAIMAGFLRQGWPIAVGVIAIILAAGCHETSLANPNTTEVPS